MDNIQRYTNNIVVHKVFLRSTSQQAPQDPRFHPLAFKLGLSGSGTKCTMVRGLLYVVNISLRPQCLRPTPSLAWSPARVVLIAPLSVVHVAGKPTVAGRGLDELWPTHVHKVSSSDTIGSTLISLWVAFPHNPSRFTRSAWLAQRA